MPLNVTCFTRFSSDGIRVGKHKEWDEWWSELSSVSLLYLVRSMTDTRAKSEYKIKRIDITVCLYVCEHDNKTLIHKKITFSS